MKRGKQFSLFVMCALLLMYALPLWASSGTNISLRLLANRRESGLLLTFLLRKSSCQSGVMKMHFRLLSCLIRFRQEWMPR